MPIPVSSICTTASSPSVVPLTQILPPSGVYLAELLIRLTKTCFNRWGQFSYRRDAPSFGASSTRPQFNASDCDQATSTDDGTSNSKKRDEREGVTHHQMGVGLRRDPEGRRTRAIAIHARDGVARGTSIEATEIAPTARVHDDAITPHPEDQRLDRLRRRSGTSKS